MAVAEVALGEAENNPGHTMRFVRLVGRHMTRLLRIWVFVRRSSKTARKKYPAWRSAMSRAVLVHNMPAPRNC
jgi:hypothetical protein